MQPLGVDIISELTELEEEDAEDQEQWEPFFDPQRFQRERELTSVEPFALPVEELKNWGMEVTKIRKQIMDKANEVMDPEIGSEPSMANTRSRRGLKLSRPSDNPDGLKEFEIRALEQADQGPGKRFRRRHRKELAHGEILEIVRLS